MDCYYEKFSTIRLLGIPPHVNIRKVLSSKVADAQSNPISMYNAIGGLYYFFRKALIEDKIYKYHFVDNPAFLLYYGKSSLRRDHQATFLKFAKHFKDADAIYAETNTHMHYRIYGFFFNIIMGGIWLSQMFANRIPFFEAFNALPYILHIYLTKKEISVDFIKNFKFVVVYCDVSPDENYMVQQCAHYNITTMTLQHGIFSRKPIISSIADTAFELSESISNYYLAWNQYTKDEAVKVGLNPDKIIVLGSPKFIDVKEPEKPIKANNNIFGVILNNSAFDHHNRCLIKMANIISDKMGYNYILRYHPQMSGNEYEPLYGKGYIKKDNNKHTIMEYVSGVAFTIISSSSVFIDLLLLKHPTYRLKVSERDNYSTVEYNSFTTFDEFDTLISNRITDNSAFDYLCYSYDVYDNYRRFFDTIIGEK